MKKLIIYKDGTHDILLVLAARHADGSLLKYISEILDNHAKYSGIVIDKPAPPIKKKQQGAPIMNISKPGGDGLNKSGEFKEVKGKEGIRTNGHCFMVRIKTAEGSSHQYFKTLDSAESYKDFASK